MSTFYPYQLECPDCHHSFRVELVEGIHISRLPLARQQILDGTFQTFTCPECKSPTVVEASVVYTDFVNHHYVAVESAAHSNWHAARLRHESVFNDCFIYAPPIAQEMGRRMKKRLVFGLRALREKLLLWDAGLDDRVVEAVKGDLIEQLGLEMDEVVFRLSTIFEGGHLMFARFQPAARNPKADGQPAVLRMERATDYDTVPADAYRRRAAEPDGIAADFPWLAEEWLVDIHGGPAYLYAQP